MLQFPAPSEESKAYSTLASVTLPLFNTLKLSSKSSPNSVTMSSEVLVMDMSTSMVSE